jgi:hypothetical protein
MGVASWLTTTTAEIKTLKSDATYTTTVGFTSTVPMTWTTNDTFGITGTYEAA